MQDKNDTVQINSTIEVQLRDRVVELAEKEKRSFSSMVAILLEEAADNRKKSKK